MPLVEGRAWRAGDLVLTTAGHAAAAAWAAEHLAPIAIPGVRLAPTYQTQDGRWVVDGWVAHGFVAGRADTTRWAEILDAGAAFHAALARFQRPAWIEEADDPWTRAGRFAWDEADLELTADAEDLVAPLLAARRPVTAAAQIVHGDLTGNVLFASGLDPAIVDLTLVWRPPAYADAVVAVDCFEWEGAGPAPLERVAAQPEGIQMLLRAALFRAARGGLDDRGRPRPFPADAAAVHRRTIEWLAARA